MEEFFRIIGAFLIITFMFIIGIFLFFLFLYALYRLLLLMRSSWRKHSFQLYKSYESKSEADVKIFLEKIERMEKSNDKIQEKLDKLETSLYSINKKIEAIGLANQRPIVFSEVVQRPDENYIPK